MAKTVQTQAQASAEGVKVISRTLPGYNEKAENWDLMESSYIGGKAYIEKHLFKYYIEGDEEYRDRVARAHRENHSKRIVDLFTSYLFQEQPTRDTKDASLQAFHDNIDGKGTPIDRFMKSASLWSSVFGRIYIMVDKPALPDSEVTGTAADNINPKAQPYVYRIKPQDVKDIAFNDNGSVKWVSIVEYVRDDSDPFISEGDIEVRYRLWTETDWYLFDDKGNQMDTGTHGLKEVPIVILDNEEAENKYNGQSLIGDIAYLDRAIFNNWSRLDAIVCDQTFSQLIFPIEGMIADVAGDEKLREQFLTLATNRILLYSSQAQVAPSYISPDASQATFILSMLESQTKQLYANIGLKNETATETSSESGVAKAWDFDKLNKMLADKADNLEHAENKINELFGKWTGREVKCAVDYPEKFDTRSLMDEIAIVQQLALLSISQTFTKEVEKLLAMKALPKADDKTMEKIKAEIDAKAMDDDEAGKDNVFDFDNKKDKEDVKTKTTKTPSNDDKTKVSA